MTAGTEQSPLLAQGAGNTAEAGKPLSWKTAKKRTTGFILAAVLALTTIIGLYVYGTYEAGKLKCSHINLPKGILPGMEGLRILVISDIHNNDTMLSRAVEEGLGQKPDIAFILGDVITGSSRTTRTRKLIEPLQKLSSQIPTFACFGNHDMEKPEIVRRILKTAGVILLENEATAFKSARLGKHIMVAALGDWWEGDSFPKRCLQPVTEQSASDESTDTPVIVLSHNPAGRHEAKVYRWNLMLSGHTHGSQIRYPFTNKPVFTRDGETLTEGYLDLGEGKEETGTNERKGIFVTRGIGSLGNLRFNCPPEFNILIVH